MSGILLPDCDPRARPRRRVLLAATAAFMLPPARARDSLPMAPGGRPWRIGWLLVSGDREAARRYVAVFVAAMREKGWALGEHYTIEERFSGGDARRFPALAAELIALAPDVLIALETTARVLRQHTTTIPIVLFASLDPVSAGLVESLGRPGTNVTGISNVAEALIVKNIEALFEIVPHARRIAVLYDPGWSATDRSLALAREVATAKGVELDAQPITADAQSVRAAFSRFDHQRPDGLLIFNNAATAARADSILAEVRALRIPAAGLIEAGGLARHAPDLAASLRESADFVDRIFRGARAADLPVRQVKSVVVTVNARLAREIGVQLPKSLLTRANEVIE